MDSPPADTVLTITPEPTEPPPELLVLPDPKSQHDVLRVTRDSAPKTVTNRFGKNEGSVDSTTHVETSEDLGNLYLDYVDYYDST